VSAPLVSICIPNFNYGRYLRTCVESALAQGGDEIEVIVSDNASTDDSLEVLASIEDPRLRFWRNDSNVGVYPNWDKALSAARGRWVKVLQSDDWLEPGFVARCLEALEHTGASCAFTGYRDVGLVERTHLPTEICGRAPFLRPAREALPGLLWGASSFVPPTPSLYERSLVPEGYSSATKRVSLDFVYWAKAMVRGAPVFVNEALAVQRQHAKQDRRTADPALAIGDFQDGLAILIEGFQPRTEPIERWRSYLSTRAARTAIKRLMQCDARVALNIARQLADRRALSRGLAQLAMRPKLLLRLSPDDFGAGT
jgi:hypothetical protein